MNLTPKQQRALDMLKAGCRPQDIRVACALTADDVTAIRKVVGPTQFGNPLRELAEYLNDLAGDG